MRDLSKEHMERMREMRFKVKTTKKTLLKNFTDEELVIYLKGTSEQYSSAFRKAFSGTRSLKTIVKAKCIDCVGFEDCRNAIKNCSVKFCALWGWRPYQ